MWIILKVLSRNRHRTKVITRTPRSTVGSMTEIYDYLRLLFARVGKTISPVSGKEVKKDDVNDVVETIASLKCRR